MSINALSLAVKTHHQALLRAAGSAGVYLRGIEAVEIDLVPALHTGDEYGGEYETITADSMDWLIWADDLVIDSKHILPLRGDRLEVDGSKYEVVPRGEVDVFRFTDHSLQVLRVFTVRVSE